MELKLAGSAGAPAIHLCIVGSIAFITAKHKKEEYTYDVSHKWFVGVYWVIVG
jgi:hypothetical protein